MSGTHKRQGCFAICGVCPQICGVCPQGEEEGLACGSGSGMEWVREGVENSAGDRPRCGAFSSSLESEWRIELPPGARPCFWGGIFVVTKRSWLRCKNLDKGGFLD